MQKNAFTIAEVLITLAIIGIIAAMTIPSIVVSNQKAELESRFAKSYSTVMNVVNLAQAENGPLETWDWKESYSQEERINFVKTYFLPYLKVLKFCQDSSSTGCFGKGMYKRLNGTDWQEIDKSPYPQVLLTDGTSINFYILGGCLAQKNRCLCFNIDSNGPRKPNTIGLDVYSACFYPQVNEFQPFGVYVDKSYDETTKSFRRYTSEEVYQSCTGGGNGDFCAVRIIQEGFKINY